MKSLSKKMCRVKCTIFILFVFYIKPAKCNDTSIGSQCSLKNTGAPGVCKLLSDCESVRLAVIKLHQLPQTCGFEETQAIVCCPKDDNGKNVSGVISKMKCKEYSSYADGECGHKIVKRIVNGVTASRKEFPHMAQIGFETEKLQVEWACGGNIISEYFILTTAHCLNDITKGPAKYVRVGVTHLNHSDNMQEFEIAKLIPHPGYRGAISVYNDIGLIKLKKAINLNSYARPACLYADSEISSKEAIATGWGSTGFGGENSDQLLKVTLNLLDYDTCNKTYEKTRRLKHGFDPAIQICAGGNDGKDTCAGDAGGPLQVYHAGDDIRCMYDIVGITSFGKGCGLKPGIYTKVSYYIKWIEDNVWVNAS